jgi:hypothetical protein
MTVSDSVASEFVALRRVVGDSLVGSCLLLLSVITK